MKVFALVLGDTSPAAVPVERFHIAARKASHPELLPFVFSLVALTRAAVSFLMKQVRETVRGMHRVRLPCIRGRRIDRNITDKRY